MFDFTPKECITETPLSTAKIGLVIRYISATVQDMR